MNRQSFIRNLIGAGAAVVIGKKLDFVSSEPAIDTLTMLGIAPPDVIAASEQQALWEISFLRETIRAGDILKTSDGSVCYVTNFSDEPIARSVETGKPMCKIKETDRQTEKPQAMVFANACGEKSLIT